MTTQGPKAPHVFYRTGPMPCPYLPGRVERNLFTELRGPGSQDLHNRLAGAGFRRSHYIVYRPACQDCNACVPVRVVVASFSLRGSLRRVMRCNEDVSAHVTRPKATPEQYELFARYQRARHPGGEMAAMSFNDYRAMVEDSAVDTFMVEFRDTAGTLIAGCLVDRLANGLSAIYSFFASDDDHRSLGTMMVLWLIARATAEELPYVYLGYWVEQSSKMTYKTRFRPLQALGPTGWQYVPSDRPTAPQAAGEAE